MPDVNATFGDIVLVAFVDEITHILFARDGCKLVLATDALASVDGFHVMAQLTFQQL